MEYQTFIFKDYRLSEDKKSLELEYGLDATYTFVERYDFGFEISESINTQALDAALQQLFFIAGISYFKAGMPPEITTLKGDITPDEAKFYEQLYHKGLGEFFYVNSIDPRTPITFPTNIDKREKTNIESSSGILIGIGGGKDSLVSLELLKDQPKVATWSVGHRSQLSPLVELMDTTHLWVERTIDPQLFELNSQGALNGHIPISALFAALGTVIAILAGYQDVIVSNENSANEPTLTYSGIEINHQYSKSLEFEKSYQKQLNGLFGDTVRYFSFLRPLSELHIGKLFAKIGFDKYKGVFSSCNRAFMQRSTAMSWCGTCPKCAFVFLILTPFIERSELEAVFHGKNLLLDPHQEATYRQLLGIQGDKPLECVGEIKESRSAMLLVQEIYPDLKSKYEFEVPAEYYYLSLAPHAMPEYYFEILKKSL